MIAFFVSFAILVSSLAAGLLAWLFLGKAEPRCPGCDLPESLCECGDPADVTRAGP